MRKKQATAPEFWKVGVRCWMERKGKVVLGTGRADLLEQIEKTRSIRAAASDLGMSYRRAWLLVQSINNGAGEPLIETATGGKRGGGAVLTTKGRELLANFRKLETTLNAAAAEHLGTPLGTMPQQGTVQRRRAKSRGK